MTKRGCRAGTDTECGAGVFRQGDLFRRRHGPRTDVQLGKSLGGFLDTCQGGLGAQGEHVEHGHFVDGGRDPGGSAMGGCIGDYLGLDLLVNHDTGIENTGNGGIEGHGNDQVAYGYRTELAAVEEIKGAKIRLPILHNLST